RRQLVELMATVIERGLLGLDRSDATTASNGRKRA
ncbi:MAG: hypothetical protein QOD50_1074, partial [Actinomycetota bacterium]|nr:hypothetical protein [Actinomycetota bacterium]